MRKPRRKTKKAVTFFVIDHLLETAVCADEELALLPLSALQCARRFAEQTLQLIDQQIEARSTDHKWVRLPAPRRRQKASNVIPFPRRPMQ